MKADAQASRVHSGHSVKNPLKFSLTTREFLCNPHPIFAKMREAGEIIPVKFPIIGAIWLTTTHAASSAVLKGKESFIIEGKRLGKKGVAGMQWWMPRNWLRLANNMLGKDELDHRRLRKLVDKVFVRHDMLDMRPRMEAIADRLLDKLEGQKECDLAIAYARRLPLAAISELLGVEEQDREAFIEWSGSLTSVSSV